MAATQIDSCSSCQLVHAAEVHPAYLDPGLDGHPSSPRLSRDLQVDFEQIDYSNRFANPAGPGTSIFGDFSPPG